MDTRKEDRENLGFYRGRLDDSGALYEIIDPDESPGAIADFIVRLKHPAIYVFIDATDRALVSYEPTYGPQVPWYNMHVMTHPSIRGREVMQFFLGTGIWMAERTNLEVATIVVPEFLKRNALFVAHCGADRRFEIEGNMMFTMDIRSIDKYKEKHKKLKETLGAQEAQGVN